jgi:hypothetical protein
MESPLNSMESTPRFDAVDTRLDRLEAETAHILSELRKMIRRFEIFTSDLVDFRAGLRSVEDRLDKIEANPS